MGSKPSKRAEGPPLITSLLHDHPLIVVPAKSGNGYAMGFNCNSCMKGTPSQKRWWCSRCNYDLCEACASKGPLIQPTKTVTCHDHPLLQVPRGYPTDKYENGYWCDSCGQHDPTSTKWWCDQCTYDLCENCIKAWDESAYKTSTTTPISFNSEDEDKLCIICYEAPKNASLMHNNGLGHTCCCLGCAKLIQAKDNKCPLCRSNIVSIVEVEAN